MLTSKTLHTDALTVLYRCNNFRGLEAMPTIPVSRENKNNKQTSEVQYTAQEIQD